MTKEKYNFCDKIPSVNTRDTFDECLTFVNCLSSVFRTAFTDLKL